jgi:hypothetical protein
VQIPKSGDFSYDLIDRKKNGHTRRSGVPVKYVNSTQSIDESIYQSICAPKYAPW